MKIDRRGMIAGAVMGAGLAAAPTALAAQTRRTRRRTFVLVHGGGHGGWCWKRVAEPLRAAGHLVHAPSLTGMADRAHLLNPGIDLDTQITDIVNLLEYEELSDVILVGHSYGGMVITGVADRVLNRIGHLVYLDAAHPKNGTSLFGGAGTSVAGSAGDAAASSAAAGRTSGSGSAAARGMAAALGTRTVNGVELMLFPDEALIKGPLGVTKPEDVAWMMKMLTPHPAKCFFQPLRLENEAAVRKLPATDIWRAAMLQGSGGASTSWVQRRWGIDSTSHNLMITEPKQTTDMLLKIAAM